MGMPNRRSGRLDTHMVRLNKKLDPLQTGREAEKLHSDLQKLVVGQEEAVDQIVNIYQTYLGRHDQSRSSDW